MNDSTFYDIERNNVIVNKHQALIKSINLIKHLRYLGIFPEKEIFNFKGDIMWLFKNDNIFKDALEGYRKYQKEFFILKDIYNELIDEIATSKAMFLSNAVSILVDDEMKGDGE